jgi:hypothetical protein
MIKFIEKETPEITYPVGRKCKGDDGLVVIFWSEELGTVIYGGRYGVEDGLTVEEWVSCQNYDVWQPCDIEITEEQRILDYGPAKGKIAYPIAKRDRKDGYIVLFIDDNKGIVAANNPDAGYTKCLGWVDCFGDINDPKWEPVDLKISG